MLWKQLKAAKKQMEV
ncbi:hypothetical protein [Anabaena lutea]